MCVCVCYWKMTSPKRIRQKFSINLYLLREKKAYRDRSWPAFHWKTRVDADGKLSIFGFLTIIELHMHIFLLFLHNVLVVVHLNIRRSPIKAWCKHNWKRPFLYFSIIIFFCSSPVFFIPKEKVLTVQDIKRKSVTRHIAASALVRARGASTRKKKKITKRHECYVYAYKKASKPFRLKCLLC